ncbi:hypothetical protein AURDEDRAFT_143034 [Auricularia subglabra TFB-10046 SS5]|nr:hypothetical protein AURDEDRAFT_143034 [Auricularia subglabra TFB-10046 SS5]
MFVAQALLAAAFAATASAHATWQQLWINGVDFGSACVRRVPSNSPVTSVSSADMACNAGTGPAPNTCAVKAGDTITVEMHQQQSDRNCANEAIGGQHYGPIMIYLGKVANASTAAGASTGWFKIHDGGLMSNNPDYFANQVLNDNCGHWTFKIPSDVAAGQYLLRAETIALHVAGSSGGAQFYMSCYQLNISGGGSANPPTVRIPGAYSASDPGILVDIHRDLSTYVIPGPAPYGTPAATVAATAWPRTPTVNTANLPKNDFTTIPGSQPTQTQTTGSNPGGSPTTTSSAPGATQTKWGQCGGQGWTGPTVCEAGSTCTVSSQYYSQCL